MFPTIRKQMVQSDRRQREVGPAISSVRKQKQETRRQLGVIAGRQRGLGFPTIRKKRFMSRCRQTEAASDLDHRETEAADSSDSEESLQADRGGPCSRPSGHRQFRVVADRGSQRGIPTIGK